MQTNANAQRDLDTLTALNLDFFASVQKGDVKRFEEICIALGCSGREFDGTHAASDLLPMRSRLT